MRNIRDIILVLRVLADIGMSNARRDRVGRTITTYDVRWGLMEYLVQEITPGSSSVARALREGNEALARQIEKLAWDLAGEMVQAAADLKFLRLVVIDPETTKVEWTELGARTHYAWEGRNLNIARIEQAMPVSDANDWATACVEAMNADEGVQMFPDELVVA